MEDYRDEHSPDIALLLTLARAVRAMVVSPLASPLAGNDARVHLAEIDDAMKPFERYPDPVTDD